MSNNKENNFNLNSSIKGNLINKVNHDNKKKIKKNFY